MDNRDLGTFDSTSFTRDSLKRRSRSESPKDVNSKTLSFDRDESELVKLPVEDYREELMRAVQDHAVLIIMGETGSGKTTKIPQYLLETYRNARIVVTQPRRVAAIAAASRVAEERHVKLGKEVGYTIRFDDCTSIEETRLRYVTDGILLRECLDDPNLLKYDIVILDEAHERSLDTDVLFGLMKTVRKRRCSDESSDGLFRLLIMSATLNSEKFLGFFEDAPLFHIPGRSFDVEIFYMNDDANDNDSKSAGNQQDTERLSLMHYVKRGLDKVLDIHRNEGSGDILVFLTGQKDIDEGCKLLEKMVSQVDYREIQAFPKIKEMLVMPLYGALETEFQRDIFRRAPRGFRKVILSTNIAATSLTIEGIRFVIDLGFVKQHVYDPQTDMDALIIVRISQSEAQQRAGRAGRTRHGKCFRLYSKQFYENEMRLETQPELQRTSLTTTVLELKKMGIPHILQFDFMDPPEPIMVLSALKQLYTLGAIDRNGAITEEGTLMTRLPLPSKLARVIVAGMNQTCLNDLVTLVALLSAPDILVTSHNERIMSTIMRSREHFFCPEGDHLTLLRIYDAWKRSNYSKSWSSHHGFHQRHLMMARHIRRQLWKILQKFHTTVPVQHHDLTSKPSSLIPSASEKITTGTASILKLLCTGFYTNAARKHPSKPWFYPIGSDSHLSLYIHPSSFLAGHEEALDWVLFHDIVYTTKAFMKCVSTVAFSWIDPMMSRLQDLNVLQLSGLDSLPFVESTEPSSPPQEPHPSDTSGPSHLTEQKNPSCPSTSNDSVPVDHDISESNRNARLEEARQKYLKRQKHRSFRTT